MIYTLVPTKFTNLNDKAEEFKESNYGFRLYSADGQWYVNTLTKEAIPFYLKNFTPLDIVKQLFNTEDMDFIDDLDVIILN